MGTIMIARVLITAFFLAASLQIANAASLSEIADAVMKHERAATERAQHVDDDDDAARVGGTGEQAPAFDLHRVQ